MPPRYQPASEDLRQDIHRCRRAFQELVEPHRPDLWRHCRWLTGDPWDAEDLAQDTLLRAFSWLSRRFAEPPAMRAWLLRIATNRWIDRCREREPRLLGEMHDEREAPPEADPIELGEAAAILLALPPRERAAVALVDGLGLTAAEAASCIGTSEGATRAALHRGRARLRETREAPARPRAPAAAVDARVIGAFCRAFNARDFGALRELLLPHAQAEVIGLVREDDRDGIMDGSLAHTVVEQGNPSAEPAELDGEAVAVIVYDSDGGGRTAGDILRFDTIGGRIASFRYYYFCPELLREVGQRLGREFMDNGYWM